MANTEDTDPRVEIVAEVMFNYDAAPDGETWADADDEDRRIYRGRAISILVELDSVR